MVAGSFAREGTLESGARGKKISTHHRTRDPNWDLVLARIGSDGTTRWTRVIGGPHTDAIRGLVSLPDGNLALLGLCQGLIDIDGIANDSALECDRESPVVLVAVYTPEGEFVRGRAYPDSLLGDPSDFAALSDGAVAVAGRFAGTLTPAGGPTLTSDGWPQPFFDGFVARFAVDLEFVWLRHLRGPRSTGADAVVGDRDGGVWVWTSAELDLAVGDGATYTKPLANGGRNAALLRFDRAGALVSAALQGGKPDAQNLGNGAIDPMLGEVRAADILLAPDGGLRLVGQFSVDAVLTAGDARLVLRTADTRGTLHLDAFIAAVPPPR